MATLSSFRGSGRRVTLRMTLREGPDRMSGIGVDQQVPMFHASKLDSVDSIEWQFGIVLQLTISSVNQFTIKIIATQLSLKVHNFLRTVT